MLILVRHGQTAANAKGLLLGRADPPLTELGKRQAMALGATTLSDVDRVVSSPLRRAMDTAHGFGRKIEVDERWIELDYGVFDGQPSAPFEAELWRRWQTDLAFVPQDGESLLALGKRVRAACDSVAGDASQRNIVVVTHVSPIKAAVAWALGAPDQIARHLFVEDGAVCRIAVTAEGPMLLSFNERHPPRPGPR